MEKVDSKNPSVLIERIKLLENHILELRSIVSNFFQTRSQKLKNMKLFQKCGQKSDTIDDLDISINPEIL